MANTNVYWRNREYLKRKAKEHYDFVMKYYKDEIDDSIIHSMIYTDHDVKDVGLHTRAKSPIITLEDTDSVDAVISSCLKYNKSMVLNFASFHNPGGKFLEGSIAQEESLCHKSTLFPVLDFYREIYYKENRKYYNNGLYDNRAIYSPNIIFFGECGKEYPCDVLTCAAPNLRNLKINNTVTPNYNSVIDADVALISRIRFIMDIIVKEKVEFAVLGAFGCGVFCNDPNLVAYHFLRFCSGMESKLKKVVFAVPKGIHTENYDAFESIMRLRNF